MAKSPRGPLHAPEVRQRQQEKIIAAATCLAERHREHLNLCKRANLDLQRPDWLWHSLVRSFSTMGNTGGASELTEDWGTYSSVAWSAMEILSPSERRERLVGFLRSAKVRMADIKASQLSKNFLKIEELGGPSKVKEHLMSLNGSINKIQFFQLFSGIGPKRARNIMMEVYDSDFHETIAIDSRILAIIRTIDICFNSYEELEGFLLEAANHSKLQGWELDRLMVTFKDEFIEMLRAQKILR